MCRRTTIHIADNNICDAETAWFFGHQSLTRNRTRTGEEPPGMDRSMSRNSRLKRGVLAVAGLAAAATLLAGCGTQGPGGGGSGGSTGASVWNINGVTEDAFNNSFDSWNKDNPDEQFSVESFANDPFKQKIRTAVGASDAPTLIYNWGGGTLQSYVASDAVVDLTDELAADPTVTDRFLPSIADVGKVDGKTYAVPNNGMKPVMMYYNKDLFAKIGAEPPKTWDDLMALVPKFLDAGIAPITVSGQARWPLLMWEAYLIDRVGGPEVMQNITDNKPDAWSDPAVIKANTMIQQLVDAGGFVKGFSSISTDSGADLALLYSGKAAMILGLPSTYQQMQTSQPDFVSGGHLGYAPFPAVDGGKGDPANVVGNPSNYWAVSASASKDEQKVALDYIKDKLLNDSYVDDLLKVGNVPPVAGIEDKIAASSDPDYFMQVYRVSQDAPHFQLSLDQALDPSQAETLLTSVQQVFLKQFTPQQFADAMNETLAK
jgi:raffinose/stachyose/melibiose transport system substrate-binding protein